ncbi:hypothetical protein PPRY_a3990 [Pseudoalteromonas prydzensis ACAM 620]|nr:hypothetical protein [Pseudoalteromonas prydzensis ACAM 620]
MLKSITQYKSLLNQPAGRFTGTYSHRCYFLKGTAFLQSNALILSTCETLNSAF